jgi:thiol-disulfide isomerase/thioredoxin
MHILHVNTIKEANKMNEFINKGADVFILVYMEGCGPCNATRPEWAKIESALQQQYSANNNLVVVDVNSNLLSSIKYIGSVDGFPTMKYIGNRGEIVESYEDSSIKRKDRSIDSFIDWIEFKIQNVIASSPHNVYKRISKKNTKRHTKKGGQKWSRKYKNSINCSKPKGFSQKQYCKYGKK